MTACLWCSVGRCHPECSEKNVDSNERLHRGILLNDITQTCPMHLWLFFSLFVYVFCVSHASKLEKAGCIEKPNHGTTFARFAKRADAIHKRPLFSFHFSKSKVISDLNSKKPLWKYLNAFWWFRVMCNYLARARNVHSTHERWGSWNQTDNLVMLFSAVWMPHVMCRMAKDSSWKFATRKTHKPPARKQLFDVTQYRCVFVTQSHLFTVFRCHWLANDIYVR